MIPFSIYTLAFIIIAFAAGFFLGKRKGKNGNHQNAPSFADSKVAKEARKKGEIAVARRIEKRKARILAQAEKEGRITNDGVEDLFCISDSTARNYLNDLEAEGKLTQVGESGRGVYYTPKSRS